MDPNERQVGGIHYQADYQHWDLVLNLNLGYLDGVTTKYLTRWQKAKNPQQDLEKACHYIDKMIATASVCYPRLRLSKRACLNELQDYIEANDLEPAEASALVGLVTWETPSDLLQARRVIEAMIKEIALPVPAEDSNRHAERANED